MAGYIRGGFPRIKLTRIGQDQDLAIEFIIDTAFDGELAMPPPLIARALAHKKSIQVVRFADGTRRTCAFYELDVEWEGELRTVEVVELEGDPLVGIHMLDEHSMQMDITEGGEVVIDPF